ncbi:MAG: NADH-quinone oxidoreductase subunit H [Gemmatimonadota bacterium]|nr:NADH-quinone oxidoreductase subunit H [Gemmatimonadota bacterium]
MSWERAIVWCLWTAVFLTAGVYITAVLDCVIARAVSRQPIHACAALTRPAQVAALLLLQRPTRTERPDAALWLLAPALLASVAAGIMAAIPIGPSATAPGIDAGIVYVGALMALVMVAVFVHGWAANSLFPLIGGYRFVALALSYEMPLALVLIGAALPAQSLAIDAIVRSQVELWNVVRQPLGLPIYLVASLGLAFRGPLDVPDAADLAGGTTAERAGVDLLLWRVARDAILVAVAALGATAFLGGWMGPWLPGPVWLTLKTLALVAVLLLVSHLVGRVRLERFVVVAWVVLIPLALVDVFAAGVVALLGVRT